MVVEVVVLVVVANVNVAEIIRKEKKERKGRESIFFKINKLVSSVFLCF